MIYKMPFGSYYAIGSNPKEIIGKYLSVWNFGAINGELLDIGEPEQFQYFLCEREKYIYARAKNMVFNWPWSYKGRKGGCFKLALLKAKLEFESFKEEDFLLNSGFLEINERNLGWIPAELSQDLSFRINFNKEELNKFSV